MSEVNVEQNELHNIIENEANGVSNEDKVAAAYGGLSNINPDEVDYIDRVALKDLLKRKYKHTIVLVDDVPVKLTWRPLTPGEKASIEQSMYGELAAYAAEEFKADATEEEVQAAVKQKLAENFANFDQEEYDRRIASTIQMALINPSGMTIEDILEWDPDITETLYNDIMNRESTPVRTFH